MGNLKLITMILIFFTAGFVSAAPVINLTFDESLLNDTAGLHTWTNINGVQHTINRSICKWYGCAIFNKTSVIEHLRTTSNFEYDESGYGFSYWIYLQTQASGTASTKPGYNLILNTSSFYWEGNQTCVFNYGVDY